jgi:hypothetical protein
MDWGLRVGLFITIITTGGVLMISQWCVGLGAVIFGGIWGFLFLCPKSPIRQKCWYNSSLGVKLVSGLNFGTYGDYTKPNRMKDHIGGDSKVLRGDVDIVSLKGEIVDSIKLRLGRDLLESDWEPQELDLKDCLEVKFFVPDYITPGRYKSYIVISNKNGKAKSPPFEAEIPAITAFIHVVKG